MTAPANGTVEDGERRRCGDGGAEPWLYERSWPEIRAYLERDDVVLLPVGSTEQHARHLPVMIDAAEAIAVGHACEEETSQMLHSYPQLVNMAEARRATHAPSGRFCMAGFATVDPAVSAVNFAWAPATPEEFLARSAPTGVSGAPTLATAERGRTIFEAQVENLCDLIAQSRRVAVTMREVRVPI